MKMEKNKGVADEEIAEDAASAKSHGNSNLHQAGRDKKDEFYTQYVDIEKEVTSYIEYNPDVFRDKTIFCNCDDPFESNFFKFFALKFREYGLKKLIATNYDPSPIANTQLLLWDEPEEPVDTLGDFIKHAYKIELTDIPDMNADGRFGLEDVEEFLEIEKVKLDRKEPSSVLSLLEGDGDFRSEECVELLIESDVVITNPPFSKFREFIAMLVEHEKQLLIIGNMNAITYKDVFPLIEANKLWLGPSISSGDREFQVPDSYPLRAAGWRIDEQGRKFLRIKGVRWFTNLDHGRRHEPLPLMTMADNLKYSKHMEIRGKEAYDRYDNYDAIEVPFTDAIPSDYDGVMGVPITFLDKYSPEQFEILGATQRGCHERVPDTKKYDDYWEVRPDGTRTGSSGGKTNENANLAGNDGKKNYFTNLDGREIQSAYQRIFIKKKG